MFTSQACHVDIEHQILIFRAWIETVVLEKVSIAFELRQDDNYLCVRKDRYFLERNQNLVFAADTASHGEAAQIRRSFYLFAHRCSTENIFTKSKGEKS